MAGRSRGQRLDEIDLPYEKLRERRLNPLTMSRRDYSGG